MHLLRVTFFSGWFVLLAVSVDFHRKFPWSFRLHAFCLFASHTYIDMLLRLFAVLINGPGVVPVPDFRFFVLTGFLTCSVYHILFHALCNSVTPYVASIMPWCVDLLCCCCCCRVMLFCSTFVS